MYLIKKSSGNLLIILFLTCYMGFTTFTALASDLKSGTLILLGDVLRYNQDSVWKRIFKFAATNPSKKPVKIVVISAAHKRAKLYGGYAVRALKRYGSSVELLPLSISPEDFNIDYHKVVHDQQFIKQVRQANGVFFVGGSPHRLSHTLFGTNHSSSPLADAIRHVYRSGGVIVGGIPGQIGINADNNSVDNASTDANTKTMLALGQDQIPSDDLYQGLDLIPEDWFVDQHFFSAGRLAKALIVMLQNGKKHGIGIHSDAIVIVKDNQFEVMGEAGAIIIDLSDVTKTKNDLGIDLKGVRLSYLTDGDRVDLQTLQTTLHPETREGFVINPNSADRQPTLANQTVPDDLLAHQDLTELMSIALDSKDKQAIGLAFHKQTKANGLASKAFRFRFYTDKDTRGWLTTRYKTDKYIVHNILLDVSPVKRKK